MSFSCYNKLSELLHIGRFCYGIEIIIREARLSARDGCRLLLQAPLGAALQRRASFMVRNGMRDVTFCAAEAA